MTILHLSINDIRNDTRTIKQIYSAEKNGFTVKSICFDLKKQIKKTKLINFKNIILIKPVEYNIFFLNKYFYRIYKFLYLNLKFITLGIKIKPSIIHCSDFHPLFSSTIIKFFCNSKIVYDAHELESQTSGLDKITSGIIYFIEKLNWPFIDGFITVSPSILKWYEKRFKKKRSILVYNSPLLQKPIKKNNYLKKRFKIKKHIKIFIYIGNLGNNRGIDFLLKSFNSKKLNSHIVFMGHGINKKTILEFKKKNNNIHFHSAVSAELMGSIISSADYGLCLIDPDSSLSDKYCLPNKFFEYIFFGLPVISTKLNDVVNLVKKLELGTIVKYDGQSLIEKVELIEKRKINFSIKSNKNIQYLNWENQSKKMNNLYNYLYKN
mgnify:CR=1 FL=1